MTPARIVIILVALVAAVGLALLVHSMFGPAKAPAPTVTVQAPPPPMTRVLVAKVDLAVGDRLSADNMTWQTWPAATLNAAYVTDGVMTAAPVDAASNAISTAGKTVTDMASGGGPKLLAMVGAIVRQPIFAGEPITARDTVRSGDTSYMAIRLPQGMRAMSLPLSTESGAGGFIEPGDHVDIYSTHADTSKNSGGAMVTETVLTNVLVLAIDQHPDAPKNTQTLPGNTITLEVPEASVTAVAKARGQTGLTLALRSYADIAGRPNGPTGDGHVVRIFRGGGAAETVTAQ
ncbi:MAG TPA: Flp pilus assembly protein CpaB [Caulobacteraceae bacterium]|jgi:pilus assembly protein CpaB|nr:Flp pilus assembly protein CpaB [Caulobacteraceae bacterium]